MMIVGSICSAFIISLSFVKQPTVEINKQRMQLQEIMKLDSLDYLFVGSSYVYSGINSRIFDSIQKRVALLSIATSGPYFQEFLIQDYLEHCTKAPDLVVLNVCLNSFSDISSDAWEFYPLNEFLTIRTIPERYLAGRMNLITYVKVKREQAFSYSFKSKPVPDLVEKEIKTSVRKNKGFILNKGQFNDSIYMKTKSLYTHYLESDFSMKKKHTLFNLLNSLRNRNIKFKIIEIPTFKLGEFYDLEFKEDYEEVIKEMQDKFGTTVIRYQTKLPDTCFANIDHLNGAGATIYTQNLITKL